MSTAQPDPDVTPAPSTLHPPFHTPFFYGWLIVGLAMVASLFSSGSSGIFMAGIIKPLSEDLGWSRTAITGAVTVGAFAGGIVAPLAGIMADRYGPRLLMPIGALAIAFAYFVIAFMGELWQFYLAFLVARGLSHLGISGIVSYTAVTNWFRRRRGRAFGMLSVSSRFGTAILIPTAQIIMAFGSWRLVFGFLGAVMALLVWPLAFVMRRRPEDVGLLPDGLPDQSSRMEEGERGSPNRGPEFDISFRQAIRAPTLWLLLLCEFIASLATGSIGFHQAAYYTDIGLSAGIAGAALTVYAFAAAGSGGLWPFLTEYVSERLLMVTLLILAAFSLVAMLLIRFDAGAIGASIVFGLASRGEGPLMSVIYAAYYGRASFGTIMGFVSPFRSTALAVGPLVGALAFDLTGSYVYTLFSFIGLYCVAAFCMVLARRPKPDTNAPAAPAAVSDAGELS